MSEELNKFHLILMLVLVATISYSCYRDVENEQKWVKEGSKPIRDHHSRCHSKFAGSTPSCWSDKDWEIYCQKVQCMQGVKDD